MSYRFPPFLFVHRRGAKSKKPKKVKKENWFERLRVDELKSICTSANIPTKGTKKDLIARLMGDDRTCQYGVEGKYGMNMAGLKKLCKEKDLIQSGTKLALVKRILEKDNGTNPEATAAVTKRPAHADPNRPAKKRRYIAPDLEKIYNRILKKIQMGKSSKKYESEHASKCHSSDVYNLIKEVIDKECFDKGLICSNPLFALQITKTALVCLSNNFSDMIRPGYDIGNSLDSVAESLQDIVREALPEMNIDLRKETIKWIKSLESNVNKYWLAGFCGKTGMSNFMNTVGILEDHDCKHDDSNSTDSSHESSNDFEDSKMPARA